MWALARQTITVRTVGMYARWCAANAVGMAQIYFVNDANQKYIGQSEAVPKFVRWVESE